MCEVHYQRSVSFWMILFLIRNVKSLMQNSLAFHAKIPKLNWSLQRKRPNNNKLLDFISESEFSWTKSQSVFADTVHAYVDVYVPECPAWLSSAPGWLGSRHIGRHWRRNPWRCLLYGSNRSVKCQEIYTGLSSGPLWVFSRSAIFNEGVDNPWRCRIYRGNRTVKCHAIVTICKKINNSDGHKPFSKGPLWAFSRPTIFNEGVYHFQ